MFTRQEWRQNLIGCFEIFLFMRRGVERFKTSRKAAIKSFIIPLVLLPLVLVVLVAMSEGFSPTLLISLHMTRMIVAVVLFFTAVYFLTRQFGREEYFYKFMTVTNWINIPGVLITLPIFFALLMGYDMEALESYTVFTQILGYIYSAFIITVCFRMPWEMGGFIAIVGLAINENLLDLTIFLRDIISA